MIILSKLLLLFFVIERIQCFSFGWSSSRSSDVNSYDRQSDKNKYKIVCYYTNWAQYRPKPATYFPEDVDAKLCSHVIFAFAKINDDYELHEFEWNDLSTDWAPGMYKRVMELKKVNKELKVLLAVGGWNHGSMLFSNMVSDTKRRRNFVQQTIRFLKHNNFDGLDLDWEYPANRDTEDRPDDKIYFTILCKELSADFKREGFLLTAAVAAGSKYIDTSYELHEIHKYLDFINLMAYDFRGGWDNTTGHNAPLYVHEFDKDRTLNVHWAVKKWLTQVPAEKLVLGMSAYGRSFELKPGFESCPLTDTPVKGYGIQGVYSRENGFLTYYEICEKIQKDKWKYVWSEQQKVPYAFTNELFTPPGKGIEWVGFDDVKSIEYKTKYVKENELGGAMLWSLDMDDFTGAFCNQGKYPILTTINHYLNPDYAKVEVPKANLIYNVDSKDKPILESSFIVMANNESISATDFNVFGLLQNQVMEIYKFCQCKNGTHKVFTSPDDEKSDKYSFVVDCNLKRVIFPSGDGRIINPNDMGTTKNDNNDESDVSTKINGKTKNKTVWSIFGISSAPSVHSAPYSYVLCTLFILIKTLFY